MLDQRGGLEGREGVDDGGQRGESRNSGRGGGRGAEDELLRLQLRRMIERASGYRCGCGIDVGDPERRQRG